MAALFATDGEMLVDEIDTEGLATSTCSTCGAALVELDGIWYHVEFYYGKPEHLARPGGAA